MKTAMGFTIGDPVNYHSIIGGKVTSGPHEILDFTILGHGECMAFLKGISGCVCLTAISHVNQ